MKTRLFFSTALLLLVNCSGRGDGTKGEAERKFFEDRVWPVLRESCYRCHGEARVRNNLDMSSRADLLRGGDHGPAIVPGEPERSLLIRSIRYQGDYHMPPKGKLSEQQLTDLTDWVKRGAPWPGK